MMSPKRRRVAELMGAGLMVLVAGIPAYHAWHALRRSGATAHATCTVTSLQSSSTVDSSGGKYPYDVRFSLSLPDGRSFEAEETIMAGITMPTEYARGQRVLCFHVPNRPDLLVLETPSVFDWAVHVFLTLFCLGTAVVVVRGQRRRR